MKRFLYSRARADRAVVGGLGLRLLALAVILVSLEGAAVNGRSVHAQTAASCDWCPVGSSIGSSTAVPIGTPASATDPGSNTMWLAWLQPATSGGHALVVASYHVGDSAPTLASINGLPAAQAQGISMVVRDGQPMIAFISASATSSGDLLVWHRNTDGSWSEVGAAVDAAGQFPNQPSLALSTDNHLGIAWQEGGSSTGSICYAQLNDGTKSWNPLGSAAQCARDGQDSAMNPALAFAGDTPAIAFVDQTPLGGNESVKVATVGADGTFGFAAIPAGGGAKQEITAVDLTSTGSILYMAWSDNDLTSTQSTVDTAMFDSGASNPTWSLMPGPDGQDPLIAHTAGDDTLKPSIAVGSDGVPWLSWTESSGSSWEVYGAMWDTTKWELKGGPVYSPGVLINSASALGFVGPAQGLTATPYVVIYTADGVHLVRWSGPTYSVLAFLATGAPAGMTAQVTLGASSPTTLPVALLEQDGQSMTVSVNPRLVTSTGAVFQFQGWTTACSTCLSTTAAATTTLTVTRAASFTAVYHQSGYLVTFTANLPSSAQPWSVTVNGNSCANPCAAVVPAGTVFFTFPASIPDSNPGERYVLASTNPGGSFTVNTAAANAVTASYTAQYELTLQSNPGGLGNPQSGAGNNPDWIDAGTKATITADALPTDGSGFVHAFNGWKSSPSGASFDDASSPRTQVSMSQPYTVTANYVPATVHVQFLTQGLPAGLSTAVTVDSNPCAVPCTAPLVSGTTHPFSYPTSLNDPASADTRYVLVSVQNGTSPYLVKGDATVTAIYKTQYLVTERASQPAVSSALRGAGWVDAGSQASLVAPACVPVCSDHKIAHRYRFSSWSGAAGISPPTASRATVTVNGPTTVMANYDLQYRVRLTANAGKTTPHGVVYYAAGSKLRLRAVAPAPSRGSRYTFARWTGGGTGAYSGIKRSVSVTVKGPITERASWLLQYQVTVTSSGLGHLTGRVSVGTTTGVVSDRRAYRVWATRGAHITLSPVHYVYGTRGTRYVFIGWANPASRSGLTRVATLSLTITHPVSVRAGFATQYYLWTFARNGSVLPHSGWHGRGTHLTLSSKPRYTGYRFAGWLGRGAGAYSGRLLTPGLVMRGPTVETAIWQR